MRLQHGLIVEAVRNCIGLHAVPLHFEENFDSQHRLTMSSAQLHHDSVADFIRRMQTKLLHFDQEFVGSEQS